VEGRGIQVKLLSGVSSSAIEPLRAVLATHDEQIELSEAPWTPFYDDDWRGPALVQIDTWWLTAFFDAMLGNLQEGTQDEDIQDALIETLLRARRLRLTWFAVDGHVENPLLRLRAFLQPHRSIHFTIPADVDDATLRIAVETLGDAVCYGTNVEQELSHDGSLAGVFGVEMVYVEPAGMWMEAHFDEDGDWDEGDEWNEDEEDTEITF
jgi:hypothetical protein